MTDAERAERLLRAIGDIDDRYFLAAQEEAAEKTGNIRKFRRRRAVMRRSMAAAVCALVVLFGWQAVRTDSADDPSLQAENPIQEVSGMEEAKAIVGFDLQLPEAQDPYTKIVISVVDNSMLEVSFQTADGSEEGFCIRKAQGDSDISGDYNTYASTETVTVGGRTVTMKGDGTTVSAATWTDGAYTYAIDAQAHPMSADDMTALIAAIDP